MRRLQYGGRESGRAEHDFEPEEEFGFTSLERTRRRAMRIGGAAMGLNRFSDGNSISSLEDKVG